MLEARFVPLEKWPGKSLAPEERLRSPFRATYSATLDLLEREPHHLAAGNVVIQADFRRDQLRNDGWPCGGASPSSPRVILSFSTPDGPLSFPCDRYTEWQANLRAIALSLEALRAVDRYGVTRHAEQYQGWRQIAAPGAAKFATADEAAQFLSVQAYGDASPSSYARLIRDPAARKAAYRAAASYLHPDKSASGSSFVLLQEAMAILDAQTAAGGAA